MLTIVVNDAFIGVDIIKKYPAFYARLLTSKELRTAFLDILDMLADTEEFNLTAN